MVTETTPGTYRFKGSTTQKVDSWDSLTCSVHVDAGTYTLDASDWPYDSSSWLIGIQSTLTPDDGSGQTIAFEPRGYGPRPLKAGTLRLNIFVNTTGEVDKTFTPPPLQNRLILAPHHTVWGFLIDGPEWALIILTHDRGPQTTIHPEKGENIGQ